MYSEEEFLLISGIQHFSFCRRQWALIHIEKQWCENGLTAEGRIQHERVHDFHISDCRNGILTMRDLRVKSETLGITGSCDAVEFIPCENGITLSGRKGQWSVYPVEYKHGKPKIGDCDRLQAAAQAMCLEEMFSCYIPEAAVFYCETRRRERIQISKELREKVRLSVEEMHELFSRKYTPKVKPHAECRNCSLYEICLPKIIKEKASSVEEYVNCAIREECEK